MQEVKKCHWVNEKNKKYVEYHDKEWGVPIHDDQKLFEMLILEGFQAGLSWECVLNKREAFIEAFDNFDLDKICHYDDEKLEELKNNPGIIRNRLKIAAAVKNAKAFKNIINEFGSSIIIFGALQTIKIVYEYDKTTSQLSDTISKDLIKRGIEFLLEALLFILIYRQ